MRSALLGKTKSAQRNSDGYRIKPSIIEVAKNHPTYLDVGIGLLRNAPSIIEIDHAFPV